MSKTISIPIGPGSDPARSKYAGVATVINAFAEASQQGKVPFALYSDPGLVAFATFANEGSIRGIERFGSIAYVVAGETLYKVASDATTTTIGTVIGEESVIFARNAQSPNPQIIIVSDADVYLLQNNVVVAFPDADLPDVVVSATFIDQYIVFLLRDGRFFWSEVNDADDIDALNFKTAEGRPDNGVVNVTIGREMWVLGEETVEVYATSSDADDPFPRVPGGFIGRGCKARHSAKAFDNSLIWVDDLGRVVKPQGGFTPVRVSNHGVESDIQRSINNQTASEIEGFVWSEGGHEFYQLSGADWTWVLDASNSYWHKKDSLGEPRSRIRHYARAFDKHIVGNFETATIYTMSMTAYDEAGDERRHGAHADHRRARLLHRLGLAPPRHGARRRLRRGYRGRRIQPDRHAQLERRRRQHLLL